MRILVTNDDGVDSIGLHLLARAIDHLGDVVVVAPDREYSGASAALGALHLIQPEVRRATIEGIDEVWTVNGPPGLCTMFARLGAFGSAFDLVVSGINPGANVGRSVYHSGTIGACLTARNGGISGIAVSQAVTGFGVEGQGWDEMLINQRWETAAEVAAVFTEAFIADQPTEPVVVNLNVPNLELGEIAGWRHGVVGDQPPRAMAPAPLEPIRGHEAAYTVAMSWGEPVPLGADTDGGLIERDYISVTYLSRLMSESRPELDPVTASLDRLLAGS
jgi:5'-nucleotidase